jgi:hypothetical protein
MRRWSWVVTGWVACAVAFGCSDTESRGAADERTAGKSTQEGGSNAAGAGGAGSGGTAPMAGGTAPTAGGTGGSRVVTSTGGRPCIGTPIDGIFYHSVSLEDFCEGRECPKTIREAEVLDPRCGGAEYFLQYRSVGCDTTMIGFGETLEHLRWYFDTTGGNRAGRLVAVLYADDVSPGPGGCESGDVYAGQGSLFCEDFATTMCSLCGEAAGIPPCN